MMVFLAYVVFKMLFAVWFDAYIVLYCQILLLVSLTVVIRFLLKRITGMVMGYLSSILNILSTLRPSWLIIVWDGWNYLVKLLSNSRHKYNLLNEPSIPSNGEVYCIKRYLFCCQLCLWSFINKLCLTQDNCCNTCPWQKQSQSCHFYDLIYSGCIVIIL